MTATIRVMLVEDHQVVREGLRALLEAESDIDVVAEADSGFRALEVARQTEFDIAVMDVALPGLSGIDVTRELKEMRPSVQVVMLSMHDEGPTVERALRAGARAYVLKGSGIDKVRAAIRAVAAGERYLSDGVAEYALADEVAGAGAALTQRERQILKLVAEGYTGRQIAALLSISPKTVENHRGRLMHKLGIHSTAGLVRYAMKAGLAD